jgi:hypothetical protein
VPSNRASEVVRLRVSAHPDLVPVVRAAARIVAGRAGGDDDARSRLQAAVGQAFFAVLEAWSDSEHVVVRLLPSADRITAELTADGTRRPSGLDALVERGGLGDGQELAGRGRTVRLWIDR